MWWGFYAHDCGGGGFDMLGAPDGGPTTFNDIQGEITKLGLVPRRDPHVEKCTGLHGMNFDDGGHFAWSKNRIAVYVHDVACSGGAIEYGSSRIPPVDNTISLKAANLTFRSKVQTGGNALQIWGVAGQSADIKYLEADNTDGYALHGDMSSGANEGRHSRAGPCLGHASEPALRGSEPMGQPVGRRLPSRPP